MVDWNCVKAARLPSSELYTIAIIQPGAERSTYRLQEAQIPFDPGQIAFDEHGADGQYSFMSAYP